MQVASRIDSWKLFHKTKIAKSQNIFAVWNCLSYGQCKYISHNHRQFICLFVNLERYYLNWWAILFITHAFKWCFDNYQNQNLFCWLIAKLPQFFNSSLSMAFEMGLCSFLPSRCGLFSLTLEMEWCYDIFNQQKAMEEAIWQFQASCDSQNPAAIIARSLG